jgi:hypothetical protein
MSMNFNGDFAGNYDVVIWTGGSPATYAAQSFLPAGYLDAALQASGNAGAGRILIPNYAGTTMKKPIVSSGYDGASLNRSDSSSGIWFSTAAITEIQLTLGGTFFAIGSTFDLYMWG